MSYFNYVFIFIVIIFYYFCLSYFSHSFIGIFIIIFCLGPFEASFFCRSVAHFRGPTVARTGPKQQLLHTGPIRAKPSSNYLPRASPPVFFLSRARRSFSSFLSTAWLSFSACHATIFITWPTSPPVQHLNSPMHRMGPSNPYSKFTPRTHA